MGGLVFAVVVALGLFRLPRAHAAPPIVIGGTLSLTGPTSANGIAMRNASALFADMVNAAGGVDLGPAGRAALMLDISDDAGTTNGVRSGYAALLARGVSLFLGPQSSIEVAALEVLAAAGRPTAVVLPVSSECASTAQKGHRSA